MPNTSNAVSNATATDVSSVGIATVCTTIEIHLMQWKVLILGVFFKVAVRPDVIGATVQVTDTRLNGTLTVTDTDAQGRREVIKIR